MSDTPEVMPPDPGRRALIVWYDDATNSVELDDEAFGWLEVAELLRCALDIAEFNAPVPTDLDTEDTDND